MPILRICVEGGLFGTWTELVRNLDREAPPSPSPLTRAELTYDGA